MAREGSKNEARGIEGGHNFPVRIREETHARDSPGDRGDIKRRCKGGADLRLQVRQFCHLGGCRRLQDARQKRDQGRGSDLLHRRDWISQVHGAANFVPYEIPEVGRPILGNTLEDRVNMRMMGRNKRESNLLIRTKSFLVHSGAITA